jgi:hypothetical protein
MFAPCASFFDPCRLARQVKQFGGYRNGLPTVYDPCRLVRQVKQFGGGP